MTATLIDMGGIYLWRSRAVSEPPLLAGTGAPGPYTPPILSTHVLVPIKAFGQAKLRLATHLGPAQRAELARRMAAQVFAAAARLPVAVVCDDEEVATFAGEHGADVIWTPGLGLNGAVTDGVARLAERGAAEVIVAHADLPLADDLTRLAGFPGVTLVPDRHDDGTNVLVVPTGVSFGFAYGGGSFAAHRAEADRLALPYRVLRDPRLGWDVDVPADLPVLDGTDVGWN